MMGIGLPFKMSPRTTRSDYRRLSYGNGGGWNQEISFYSTVEPEQRPRVRSDDGDVSRLMCDNVFISGTCVRGTNGLVPLFHDLWQSHVHVQQPSFLLVLAMLVAEAVQFFWGLCPSEEKSVQQNCFQTSVTNNLSIQGSVLDPHKFSCRSGS